jgi:hypothetical protein
MRRLCLTDVRLAVAGEGRSIALHNRLKCPADKPHPVGSRSSVLRVSSLKLKPCSAFSSESARANGARVSSAAEPAGVDLVSNPDTILQKHVRLFGYLRNQNV